MHNEFGGKTLPPNHPLTRHVHRIVTRILEQNNLGTLKKSAPVSAGWFSSGLDDPQIGHSDGRPVGSEEKVWELMVVKDDSIVNAMVSFDTIVVFTGILPIARDEEGLAAIIGHGKSRVLYQLLCRLMLCAEIGHTGWFPWLVATNS